MSQPAPKRPPSPPGRFGPQAGSSPSPEQVAAMVAAAVETLLAAVPAPAPTVAGRGPTQVVWRFSGRWWARPTVARRDRPWTIG